MSHRIPRYRGYRTGQARVTISGKTYYLRKFGTAASRQEYRTVIRERLTKSGRFAPGSTEAAASSAPLPSGTTVNEVALAYIMHAEVYYRSNPKEVEKIKLSVRPMREPHGRTPVVTFDSLALEAVQNEMIEAGLARTTVNELVRVLKRLFKWGAEEVGPGGGLRRASCRRRAHVWPEQGERIRSGQAGAPGRHRCCAAACQPPRQRDDSAPTPHLGPTGRGLHHAACLPRHRRQCLDLPSSAAQEPVSWTPPRNFHRTQGAGNHKEVLSARHRRPLFSPRLAR